MQLTDDQKKIVLKITGGLPNKVSIFGSRAKNTARPDSDLDLCIYPFKGESVSLENIALLRESFANSSLPFVVDLVDFNQLPDLFQKVVLSDGIVISPQKI